ncbi:MAG TPA: discoidin domain-containing protein, partial [Candidatus Eremiobacteraceae bacterium]|nr:discoidin domain-containing protein [Candidatus Eremiobacteraceae bacterium]
MIVLCVVSASSSRPADADATQPVADVVRVDTTPAHKITTFSPLRTFGGTVDKEPAGSIPALYSKGNVQAMLDAGLGWLSYRLFTELSDQDWHWNPAGTFSDESHKQGYWTSSASTDSAPVSDSYGYRLPHRGNTTDQGNNESYSRLDDGNLKTYWKSNPYLTSAFTGDPDELHPQWVVIDLEEPRTIREIKVAWANPYATKYRIDYWIGDDPIGNPGTGKWSPLSASLVRRPAHSSLGPVDMRHPRRPTIARYLRLLMTQSSNTCDTHGASDKRNCVGYAITEIWAGNVDAAGKFHDFVRHSACGGESAGRQPCGIRQTATYVSSVDPWHRSTDRVRNQEQPGLDLIVRSGLTRSLPAMYPVAMLYSSPDNAVAEVRYLQAHGYPISNIELGEEPDGQYVTPEDDAALYVQWAHALHQLDPTLKLGGPVFSGVNSDLLTWPDSDGNVSWLNRFLNYLKSHGADGELAFMSFEHYPHDNGCIHGAELQRALLINPSIIKGVVNAWHSDGIPPSTPLFITEANFSSVNYTQV